MSASDSRRIRAVIFDLDGTLIDSEPNYREVDEIFLAEHGIVLSDAQWSEAVGMGGQAFVSYLKERFLLDLDPDSFVAEKDDRYIQHARGRTRVFAPTVALLRYLQVAGAPVAVATSSRNRTLRAMLEEIDLAEAFPVALGSNDVPRSKPAPDIYLEAARRLGVPPEECLVLEDSRYGVQGARAAGMAVVALPEHAALGDLVTPDDMIVAGGASRMDPVAVVRRFGIGRVCGVGSDPDRADVSDRAVDVFRSVVWDFYRVSGRRFPWRETTDPYAILVSEFMLQQTQTGRVVPLYDAFMRRFPTLSALAESELREVLSYWQGLGYNRRGMYLHESARTILRDHGGRVPRDPEMLVALPGVGRYTAAAVAAFGFNTPQVVLETNIRRVLLYFFFAHLDRVADRLLEPLLRRSLDVERPRDWYYALMDYGAHLGRILPNPNRRSAHYRKQSRFSGSVREVRGRVLRALTRRGSLTVRELEVVVGPTDHRFAQAIEGLEKEGMVIREGEELRIR